MKRYFAGIITLVLMCSLLFVGCEEEHAEAKINYNLDIAVSDYTLDILESIDYINNSDDIIDAVLMVSYVGAYTENGNVANRSDGVAYPFGVNYATLNIKSISIAGKEVKYEFLDEMYIKIYLPRRLKPNKRVKIDILYSETLPKNRLRYGYNGTSINIGNAFIYAVPYGSELYPYSLNGDPFYTETADYKVKLHCLNSYNVLATSLLRKRIDGDMAHYEGKISNVRDYAIVMSECAGVFSDTIDGIKINYMTKNRNNAIFIATASKAIGIFSKLFCKYPYDNIAIVENDFVEGGMEYPCLIYVNSMLDKASLERVIIHEIAHQWWYGVIGVNENTDYFIDEGMAELSTYLYYIENGETNYANSLIKRYRDEYVTYHAMGGHVENMNVPIDALTGIDYYMMAYVKAPLVLYKIMNDMGNDAFIATIRDICCKYRFGIITLEEFASEFGQNGDEILKYMYVPLE